MTEKTGDNWIRVEVILTVFGLFLGVWIPYQLEKSQRDLQNQSNCTGALLELRKSLNNFGAFGNDNRGNILQDDPLASPEERGRMKDSRNAAQHARDTAYVLCRELGSGHRLVDPQDEPWIDSPSDISAKWSRKNVSDITRQTSLVMDEIANIQPKILGIIPRNL